MLKVKNKDTTIPSLDVNGYILPCILVILSFFEKKKKKKIEKKILKAKNFAIYYLSCFLIPWKMLWKIQETFNFLVKIEKLQIKLNQSKNK